MNTHDPRRFIEDLRNHLASHDRRLAFLFGAGTSSAVNIADITTGEKPKHIPLIPGIDGLTELCKDAVIQMGEKQNKAWGLIVQQCVDNGQLANVENILSKVRMKIDAIGEGEILIGLNRNELNKIEETICSTIAKHVNPPESKIPNQIPHDDFAVWAKKVNRSIPLEVFTTNYDILYERAFEIARVPFFDGFVGTVNPFFYPESIDDDLLQTPRWIRLWKIHGSINWSIKDDIVGKRVVRTNSNESGEMILPSHRKYDESRKEPYTSYMDRLARILNYEHSILITCGYSFSDEHINAIVYGALDNNNSTNVVTLQFQDLSDDVPIVKSAINRNNLTVIGPNGGVISGMWGYWKLTQPVDHKTYSFMDYAFDSNASPEDEGSPAINSKELEGQIRLGDFKWFCKFINSMGTDNQ